MQFVQRMFPSHDYYNITIYHAQRKFLLRSNEINVKQEKAMQIPKNEIDFIRWDSTRESVIL